MRTKKTHSNLQLPSGCISRQGLLSYLQNNLTIHDQQQIEKHLSECDFCKDALEGLQLDEQFSSDTLRLLDKKIDTRIKEINLSQKKTRTLPFRFIAYTSLAASIIMLIGVYFYMFQRNTPTQDAMALQQKEESPNAFSNADAIEEDIIPITEQEKPTPPPALAPPKVCEQIEIVEDDVMLESDLDINAENDKREVENIRFEEKEESENVITFKSSQRDITGSSRPTAQKKHTDDSKAEKIEILKFEAEDKVELESEEEEVFVIVEDQPTYPGGTEELMKFLAGAIYPDIARDNGLEGTVYVQFVIEKDGSITGVKILKGVDPLLDESAINRIKQMPKWKPGYHRRKPVRMYYRIPIPFKIKN